MIYWKPVSPANTIKIIAKEIESVFFCKMRDIVANADNKKHIAVLYCIGTNDLDIWISVDSFKCHPVMTDSEMNKTILNRMITIDLFLVRTSIISKYKKGYLLSVGDILRFASIIRI